MKRKLYDADHDAFRAMVRQFVEREVAPKVERWNDAGLIDRDVWLAAGAQGVIGLPASPAYGGGGMLRDFRYRLVVTEELARVTATSLNSGFGLQDDIAIPYIAALGTPEQQQRWLPKMCSGEAICAIAMTQPGTGSDLRAIRTTAAKVDGGWVLNGAKTFITSGIHADLVITVARTGADGEPGAFSLLVAERGMQGFSRGRKLKKIGLPAQDTAELFFDDVFIPDANLLGVAGAGFKQLMTHLPLERLSIAAGAISAADATLQTTLSYVQAREAFGRPIADFQNTRFQLADMATELDVTRAYIDSAVLAWNAGELSAVDAAKSKLWATETQNSVVDRCLQMHGGYGYMTEYPVARAFQDARVQRIYGGTNEIMREIIGRDLVGRR